MRKSYKDLGTCSRVGWNGCSGSDWLGNGYRTAANENSSGERTLTARLTHGVDTFDAAGYDPDTPDRGTNGGLTQIAANNTGGLSPDQALKQVQAQTDADLAKFMGGTVAVGTGAALLGTAPLVADELGPEGSIFGRASRGGDSLFGINTGDALRIGWGWKGSATAGEDVFRISGDWIESLGVKSGHIDIYSPTSGWFPK